MPDPYAGLADPYAAVADPVAAPASSSGAGTVPLIDPATGQEVAPRGKPPTPEEAAKLYEFAQRARSPRELEQFALNLRPDGSLGLTNAKEILAFRDKNDGAVSHRVAFDGNSVEAPKTWGEYANDLAHNFFSDVAGVGESLASPVDAASRALGWTSARISHLLGAPEHVTEALDHPATIGGMIEAGIPVPESTVGRYTRQMARGAGAALSGVGVGSLLARSANPVAQGVGRVLQTDPGLQMAGGATGGASAEAAKDAGGGPMTQAIAALLGGAVAPSAASGTGAALDSLVGRVVGAKPAMMDSAATFLRSNTTRPVDELVATIKGAPEPVSGAEPTLAEVTLDPGLAAVQRGVGNISPTAGGRISRQMNVNSQARLDAADAALGDGDPAAIPAAAATREAELANRAAASADRVGPYAPPDVAGAQARDALSTGYTGAKARTSDAYGHPLLEENPPVRLRPLDPEDVTLPPSANRSDLSAFQEEAVRASRSALPDQPRTLLQFVRAHGGISSEDGLAGDFRAEGMDARGQPTLLNRNGRNLDDLLGLAVEAHYVPQDTSLADFTHMLAGEYRGSMSPRFSSVDEGAMLARQEAERARDWWREQFDSRNLDPTKMSTEDWVHFYDDVNGSASSTAPTVDDLRMQSGPGRAAGPFQQTVMALRDRYFGDGGVEASAPVRNFFSQVLDADEVGLKTLEGWERQARDLAAGAPDRTQGASLKALAEAIGAKAAMESDPGRREALNAARGVRREQGQVFEEGPVGRSLGRGDYGRFTVPDSEVGKVLVPPGRTGGEAADQLAKAAPANAETIVRTEVRSALDAAGVDPRAIGRVAANYKEAISRFPELQKAVVEARQSAALAARFRETKLGAFLTDGADPVAAVGRLLTVKDGGAGFRSLVTADGITPQAVAGVRRALGEHLRSFAGTTQMDENLASVPSTAKMSQTVQAVLERTKGTKVLTDAQRKVLSSVGRELQGDQFARSANRTSGSDTMRNMGLSMRLAELSAHGIPTGGAKTILRFMLALSPAGERRMDLIAKAVQDPMFAAQLLARPTGARMDAARAEMRAFTVGASEAVAERSPQSTRPRPAAAAPPPPSDPYAGLADPYSGADELPQ